MLDQSVKNVKIDLKAYRHVYVYGTPRGGTNLFCALLHNHDAIAAINHQSAKRYTDALVQSYKSDITHLMFDRSDLIYERGGTAKNLAMVSHLAFDKVHWAYDRAFRNIRITYQRVQSGVADGIVLIRHPFHSLMSMDKFHKRYGRPNWSLTRYRVALFLVRFFLPQLWLLKDERMHGVVIEEFVEKLPDSYNELCAILNLPFEERFADFSATFGAAATWTGGKFVLRQCQVSGGGSFLTSKGVEAPAQDVYFDSVAKEPTWGYGQFNPALPLDFRRLRNFRESLDVPSQRLIRSVFRHGMSKRDVDYLFEVDLLDVERLRRFQLKGIGSHVFRCLMYFPPPRWLLQGWKWLRLQQSRVS
jgi:hypothetical protein